MKSIKLVLAAGALAVGLSTAATAMPVDRLAGLKAGDAQAEQVRLVCNRWGRCWHVPSYRSYGYGAYGYGWRGYRHHYRRW